MAPQYEQQGAPGYGQQPPPPPGTNGLAIASLIFGILGGAFLLGFIFGFIALAKTKKTGQAGRGMAIAGIVLNAVWVVIWAVIIIFAVSAVKTVINTSGAPGYGLNPGDCFNENPTSLSQVDKVSCTTPHDGEAVALIPVTGTTFPGETVLEQQANTACPAPATSYLGADADPSKLSLAFLAPNQLAWSAGNHTIACFVGSPAGKLTAPAVQH